MHNALKLCLANYAALSYNFGSLLWLMVASVALATIALALALADFVLLAARPRKRLSLHLLPCTRRPQLLHALGHYPADFTLKYPWGGG